jgi:hypothetical protein
MENKVEQRHDGKLVGGITGRGFLPGQSGNPNGRPKTSVGLISAIREKVAERAPDGRTVAEHIADMLIDESLRGKHRVAAAALILDRLEGRAALQLNVNNITEQFSSRDDEELQYHLDHGGWPEDRDAASAECENGRGN